MYFNFTFKFYIALLPTPPATWIGSVENSRELDDFWMSRYIFLHILYIFWTLNSYSFFNNYLNERLKPTVTYRYAFTSGLDCNSVIRSRSLRCIIFLCTFTVATVGSLRDWLKWSYICTPYFNIRQPWGTHKYNII